MPHFEFTSWIDAPLEKVWAFHEREDVLRLLAPPGTEVVSRKGGLETGARVEFRAPVLGPLKVRWLALHVDHERLRFFVDEQIRGPFQRWRHEHRFAEENGGTRLTDAIEYSLPLAPVSHWLAGWAVKLQLRTMFANRHRTTKEYCERPG
ncbi:MAG: SRPBCC family protein [Bryobacteraceae bacterium]|nr:SRPBCC family protein [Bryobacteraceae bacterium]